ncbi:Uncharacterised protein [Vibrio cholerae]|nr:Uncharacterised protein [Vibrio cholerae]
MVSWLNFERPQRCDPKYRVDFPYHSPFAVTACVATTSPNSSPESTST